MSKRKKDLNTIYISERMQESLRNISNCPLTAVVAPMGYGKTTAVSWYLREKSLAEDGDVIESAFIRTTDRFSGKALKRPLPSQVFRFFQNMNFRRSCLIRSCWQRTYAVCLIQTEPAIFLLMIFIFWGVRVLYRFCV